MAMTNAEKQARHRERLRAQKRAITSANAETKVGLAAGAQSSIPATRAVRSAGAEDAGVVPATQRRGDIPSTGEHSKPNKFEDAARGRDPIGVMEESMCGSVWDNLEGGLPSRRDR